MQKIREVAGNVVQSARLFNLTLVFALSGALPVTANLDLYFDTPPAYGGGDVSTAIGAAAWSPLYAAYSAGVAQYVRHFSPSVYGNASSVDTLRLATMQANKVDDATCKAVGGVVAVLCLGRILGELWMSLCIGDVGQLLKFSDCLRLLV